MMNKPNPNMLEFISMMKQGNPEQIIMSMLQNSANGSLFMDNLLQLARNKDANGLEAMGRNIAREKGLDYDLEFQKFRQGYGL